GPYPVRDRRDPERPRDTAAGLRRRAVPDLLPLPGNGGRVLRLRARAGSSAGTVAHLRPRAAGSDPAEGLQRERAAVVGDLRRCRGRGPGPGAGGRAAVAGTSVRSAL